MSINTKDTDTNNKTKLDDSSNEHTRAVLNNINDDKDATEINLQNEIEALSGRKFKGDELTKYGDVFGQKKEGMIQIFGFNINSIQLDDIRS